MVNPNRITLGIHNSNRACARPKDVPLKSAKELLLIAINTPVPLVSTTLPKDGILLIKVCTADQVPYVTFGAGKKVLDKIANRRIVK